MPEQASVDPALAQLLAGTSLGAIATKLGKYLQVGCDSIALLLLLSRVGARLGLPLHIAIASDCAWTLQRIAELIVDIASGGVKRIRSSAELSRHFRPGANGELLLLSAANSRLLGAALEYDCGWKSMPAIWWIGGGAAPMPNIAAPLLRLTTGAEQHSLSGVGHHFCSGPKRPQDADRICALEELGIVLEECTPINAFDIPFQAEIRAAIRPEEMVVVNRLLRIVAGYRLVHEQEPPQQGQVTTSDYEITRALLTTLPITPAGRSLDADVIETATLVWDRINEPSYQQTVPGHSDLGHKVFFREDVRKWSGLAYNTAKRHLQILENEGLLKSSVLAADRHRGKPIAFQFTEGRLPPFHFRNPFERLPTAEQIATGLQNGRANLTPTLPAA